MSSISLAVKQSCDQVCNRQTSQKTKPSRVVPPSIRLLGLGLNLASYISPDWAAQKLSDLWFSVFKPKPRDWVYAFWNQADRRVELDLSDKTIPVYLWGRGPLVVCMHGWSGSGTQFRELIPSLVNAGFQVAVFDAPAHGFNPGRTTHVLEFAQSLLAIHQQISPIHTVVAHSFGAMATLTASYHGLKSQSMVFIAPGLDVEEIFESYCSSLKLTPKLAQGFRMKVGQKMADIAYLDNPWQFFKSAELLKNASDGGLLIYDDKDEEVTLAQFERVRREWSGCEAMETKSLGHFKILKDAAVIDKITQHILSLPR